MAASEEKLVGGNVTQVVRVGETVRRTPSPYMQTIHRLLAHVRSKGVDWVPEPLGMDEQGREVLSFIPGDVPHDMPEWVWSDEVLVDAARALRCFHDATVGFGMPDARWALAPQKPAEVICHNDFAPYNCVFREGRFVGAIDFDFCAPGPRLWDIAYTAYRFVPLMPGPDAVTFITEGDRSPFCTPAAEERLDKFLDAYALRGEADETANARVYTREMVVAAAVERLEAIANWTQNHARTQGVIAVHAHAAMYRAHARWLASWQKPE